MNAPPKIFPPIDRPDATNLDTLSIDPKRKFEVCNDLLDDHDALEAFYEKNGYLFFRNVLDPDSVKEAREAMLAVAADEFGLVEKGDETAKWTGKAYPPGSEEKPCFSGISKRLVSYPRNQEVLAKILGEEPSMVPIVQYRLYPPNGPVTMVHQDGFYSPGIHDYKPLWIPLTPCPREVGGLTIAVGQNHKGYFHNLGKGGNFPIPDDVIDPDSWATVDFEPGDLLVVHPYSPHAGLPNTSDRLRVTFDTRVQSARNPTTFAATVNSVTSDSITLTSEDENVGTVTLSVDPSTYIRVRDPGQKEKFEEFADVTKPGMDLCVVREGDRAAMLRMGSRP
ncbi:phytanoyl-CoA dioxygenase family protein [Novosphingobium malaysiense]|uniref:Phytanoyl-CoA dioxygenase n=1 Tax=Novosphingobium malaysiense TaxID=1348853 RepID=A0A0B1ZF96_9SPHN|nr:phytanoyl-CoA dioxygenase family protein [Novosphingobium malaysiense]KHK89155.1 phytanoyl-CoA dioxygenase [Novosphingobium malaysiense]